MEIEIADPTVILRRSISCDSRISRSGTQERFPQSLGLRIEKYYVKYKDFLPVCK